MLEQNLVRDLQKYQHIISSANGGSTISDEIKESIMFLKNSEKGLGIIRCNKTEKQFIKKSTKIFK